MTKALNHSYDSTNRLIELVNDVLCVSKIESWKMNYFIGNQQIKKRECETVFQILK